MKGGIVIARVFLPAVICAAVAAGGMAPAVAAREQRPVDRVATEIARVAPDQGDVVVPVQASKDRLVTSQRHVRVTVPKNPEDSVQLATPDGVALTVDLPDEARVQAAAVAEDGTVVYQPVASEGTAVAAQVLQDGSVRLQTVSRDEGKQSFTYTFADDVILASGEGGTVDVIQELGSAAIKVGQLDAAWAVGADGRPVPTRYRIRGNELIQVLQPAAETRLPIVADPKLTRTWWNTTVYFNRKETNTLGWGTGSVAAIAAFLPEPISKAVAGMVGLSAAYAGWIYNSGKCIKFVYYGHFANTWQPYGGNEAGGYCKKKK